MAQGYNHINGTEKMYTGKNYYHVDRNAEASYELNSDIVQDIMSRVPNRIVRQGTSVLFIAVLLLFAGAYFIHYPDVIVTNVHITSSEPPVKLIAQTSGKIQRLFVRNNQMVKADANICLIENSSDYNDILLLENMLNKLGTSSAFSETVAGISFAQSLRLGELQPVYVDVCQSIQEYLFFAEKNFISSKVAQLQSQVQYQSQLDKELQSRDVLLKQQLQLERKKFQTDSLLAKEKVIAPMELDNSKKELLNKQMNADATKSGILQNRLQQTEYMRMITELQQQKLQQHNDLLQKIKDNVKRLQGQWQVWQQKYLVKSPVDGKAIFFNVWKENQFINSNEAILMIVPPVEKYIAKASLPLSGAGKVKAGQKVLIKLAAYPFDEFGMVAAQVAGISDVPLDTAYSLEIFLPKGLITTANKKIPAQPHLTGVAEIITDDKSIIERLFEKIWTQNKRE